MRLIKRSALKSFVEFSINGQGSRAGKTGRVNYEIINGKEKSVAIVGPQKWESTRIGS